MAEQEAEPTTIEGTMLRITGQEVRALGLLWAINRMLLHPLGWAIAVDIETGDMWLKGDGDEPWNYSEDADRMGRAKWQHFVATGMALESEQDV